MIRVPLELRHCKLVPAYRMHRSTRSLRQCKKYREIQVLLGEADELSRFGAPPCKGSSEHRINHSTFHIHFR